jgi:hypothetical protein
LVVVEGLFGGGGGRAPGDVILFGGGYYGVIRIDWLLEVPLWSGLVARVEVVVVGFVVGAVVEV